MQEECAPLNVGGSLYDSALAFGLSATSTSTGIGIENGQDILLLGALPEIFAFHSSLLAVKNTSSSCPMAVTPPVN
jgi:hypothetical protein